MGASIPTIIWHLPAAAIMAYGWNSLDGIGMDALIRNQKGGYLQFLTIQGLALAFLSSALSIVLVALPVGFLARVKRLILQIALPLSFVISSIYWTLLLLFPTLILQAMPPSPDAVTGADAEPSSSSSAPVIARIPLNVDLALHLVPAVTLVTDFFFFQPKFGAKEVKRTPLLLAGYALSYGIWVEWLATYNHSFPYPFLSENVFAVRVLWYLGASGIALVSFYGLNTIHP